ncbi:hypothetical protein NE237_011690 [Protea cynaroides]|uniref:Uncharacterized protein n=1 Tax=Protea cynaroides TaxID=273540 RepID=A0A9Q0GVF4_9MAGN|nr:hypothetical protein NE237_011690 [Protea cynaroides]
MPPTGVARQPVPGSGAVGCGNGNGRGLVADLLCFRDRDQLENQTRSGFQSADLRMGFGDDSRRFDDAGHEGRVEHCAGVTSVNPGIVMESVTRPGVSQERQEERCRRNQSKRSRSRRRWTWQEKEKDAVPAGENGIVNQAPDITNNQAVEGSDLIPNSGRQHSFAAVLQGQGASEISAPVTVGGEIIEICNQDNAENLVTANNVNHMPNDDQGAAAQCLVLHGEENLVSTESAQVPIDDQVTKPRDLESPASNQGEITTNDQGNVAVVNFEDVMSVEEAIQDKSGDYTMVEKRHKNKHLQKDSGIVETRIRQSRKETRSKKSL